MSDFLHNLRTGNMKRYDRPRKNYDNPQYRHQHDRQHNKDRKGNYHKKVHTGDQLQEIKKHLEMISRIIENNLKAQEKSAVALERIAAVLEATTGIKSAGTLVPDDNAKQALSEPETAPESPVEVTETPAFPNDTLLATITEMRNDGMSFDKIAAELETRGVPTVSGRGIWRGQTVSKYLKDNA